MTQYEDKLQTVISANHYQLKIYERFTNIESLKRPEYVLPLGYVLILFPILNLNASCTEKTLQKMAQNS